MTSNKIKRLPEPKLMEMSFSGNMPSPYEKELKKALDKKSKKALDKKSKKKRRK